MGQSESSFGIFTFTVPVKIMRNKASVNYACNVCFKTFKCKKYLTKHSERHLEKNIPCELCDLKFKTVSDVKTHNIIVHEKRKPHKCDICGETFPYKSKLIHHMRKHDKNYSHKCGECDRGFFSSQDLDRHVKNIHRGIRYICFPCNKAFRSMHYHKQHMKEHDPDYDTIATVRKCKMCDEEFLLPNLLRAHIKKKHSKSKKVFICDICGKTVSSNTSLATHKRIHNGEKPHVCQTCGKAFAAKNIMKVHLRTHTKERPYCCKDCGKTFTQRTTLVIHMRYHSGERPYKCDFCEKGFVSRNLLRIHSKVHGTPLADM